MTSTSDHSSPKESAAPARGDEGFILPFVLVVIASLALVAAAAFAAVARSAETIQALDEGSAEDAALATAEAQAAFAFLTSTAVTEGIWLGAPDATAFGQPDTGAAAEKIAAAALAPDSVSSPDYWRANGASRTVAAQGRRVTVRYRDAAGLFSLSSTNEDKMALFLQTLGLSRDPAVEMAARIADYEDIDNVRRFRGAERADYRLFGRQPPTNSPLRTPEELGRVLGFFDAAPPGFWRDVVDFATADQSALLAYAAPPRLSLLVSAATADAGSFDAIGAQATRPSGRARFLLEVTGERRARTRAVDIRRPPAISQTPFQRFMVYEITEIAQRAPDPDVDLAPILFADLDRASK